MSESEQAEPESPKSAPPAAATSAPPASGGKALGTVAALLALGAIAAVGYVWLEVQKLQSLPQQLQADAIATDRLRGDLEQRLNSLMLRVDEEVAGAMDLQNALTEDVAALADLALQVEQLGAQVDAYTGTDRSQRNRFLRTEALYYLRIANARALLASDAQVAAQALQLADDKLRETGDPQLNAVRAQLAEELASLRAIPELDVSGIVFRLQSLADQVATWPLRNTAPDSFSTELPGVAASDDAGAVDAWSRAKATLAGVFRSIVNVRETTERPEVQIDTAQRSLVVQSVRAELQLARLAFVTGEFAMFEQSLSNVDRVVQAYFDVDNTAVAAALATLGEVAATERPAAMPDISASLALLLETGSAGAADRGAAQ